MEASSKNPYDRLLSKIEIDGKEYRYYSLKALEDPRVERLPFSIRILLEQAIRNCDGFNVKTEDVEKIQDWKITSVKDVEIPFKTARVLLQDFTGTRAPKII